MSRIPDNIINRFAPWADFTSWVMGNEKKLIVQWRNGELCTWRKNPEDNIMTLHRLVDIVSKDIWWGGFGIILGEDNLLCCIDLDDCLDPTTHETFNPEVTEFLKVAKTFVEVSSSGHALHVFFALKNPKIEFGLKPEFCKGKLYVDRFIKLTGIQYKDYDNPIRVLDDKEFSIIKKKIGVAEVVIQPLVPSKSYTGRTRQSGLMTEESWEFILDEVMIPHFPTEYNGHAKNGKIVMESWKILCPNVSAHTHDRTGDASANLAILCKYKDGTSSLKCNHNSCDPITHPNLLKKLWNQIKEIRAERGNTILKQMGVIKDE